MLSLTLSSTGLLVINKPSRSISTNFGRMHWHVLSLLWNIEMPSEITSKYSPTQKSDAPSRVQVLRIPWCSQDSWSRETIASQASSLP